MDMPYWRDEKPVKGGPMVMNHADEGDETRQLVPALGMRPGGAAHGQPPGEMGLRPDDL